MRLFATAALLASSLLAGCGPSSTVAFEETRESSVPARRPADGMSEAERLGLQRPSPATTVPPPAPAVQNSLTWNAPEGWREVEAPGGMRLAAFAPENGDAWECVVFLLPGEAGGVRANLDRWRGQMGLEPLTDAQFQGLPRIEVMGRRVPLLQATGTYVGMGRSEPQPGAALLGAAVWLDANSVFVKLTGEAGAVAAERTHFETFCRSLRRSGP